MNINESGTILGLKISRAGTKRLSTYVISPHNLVLYRDQVSWGSTNVISMIIFFYHICHAIAYIRYLPNFALKHHFIQYIVIVVRRIPTRMHSCVFVYQALKSGINNCW